ncbi:leucyl aminopeptidase [Hyphococcus flavus]|uniref:Probable cytosol aminopeptidase n=1 Tax=Hyphococcus flavus TaxID=1866326 RepID=A0AAE9ZIN8_9PROT|nr:leucyl aminopeptidase [Hyphococcus flavus]WDI31050.1 leucyl aminopeptidase [Hyphococcus flavus]
MKAVLYSILVFFVTSSAWAQREVTFTDTVKPEGALIIAMRDNNPPQFLDALIGNDELLRLQRAIEASNFEGNAGQIATIYNGAIDFGEIHLIGLGDDLMKKRDWEDFGGYAGKTARTSKSDTVFVITDSDDIASILSAGFGAAIGQYSFDSYKSDTSPVSGTIAFVTQNSSTAIATYEDRYRHLAESVRWARDMQSEPGNILYPEEFVRRARELIDRAPNVSIDVLNVRNMEQLGMGAILGVGQGSTRPPQIMIIRYSGGRPDEAPLVYAGKGITFDTGGISLKPKAGMWPMKADMTGAAVVVGAISSIAKSREPVNVVAIAALAENMPDGGAQRPGDVVRTMSGKTVEIMSTDAEGRLVLSDAVWYAQERYNPELLVDVATLTGSVGGALSDEYGGLFTRDDKIADKLINAGELSGEDLWRLPLHPNHDKQIVSVIADLKNADTGAPGASTGAAFIGSFITAETPWAHLDIAGVDWRTDPLPTVPAGASGFGVRLLDQLARDMAVN